MVAKGGRGKYFGGRKRNGTGVGGCEAVGRDGFAPAISFIPSSY